MKSAHVVGAKLVFALALAVTGPAHAQLGGLLGGGGGGASPESIVTTYVAGAKLVLNAQERLLSAIGRKEEAARAALNAQNLTTGATKQDLEDAAKTQTENSKILEEGLKAKETALDAESKVVYAQGLASLGGGVGKYVGLVPQLKNFKPGITSIGNAALGAVYVAQTLPSNVTSLQSTLSAAIDFGKNQGVEIPADATAALK